MVDVQNLPLEWREESCIWRRGTGLVEGWEDIYRMRWMHGAAAADSCAQVRAGLQWILDYYTGKPISYQWYFPWNVPPLWKDLWADLAGRGAELLEAPAVCGPVAPAEQLAMVLPVGSWRLVRDARLKALPSKAPHYWPESFGFFSAGKRWMWECEAEVPILTIQRVRGILSTS